MILCNDCKHFTVKYWGDGSVQYGCSLMPGLITGESSIDGDDFPKRCKQYENGEKRCYSDEIDFTHSQT